MRELILRNRQRLRTVHSRSLRRITASLLDDALGLADYSLGIHLVGAREIARLNRQFLGHPGSTDVISFDHTGAPGDPASRPDDRNTPSPRIHGEIFICLDEAVSQARRFRATWQAELVRYLVHGVLHLLGFDDAAPAARRAMKREEGRRMRFLAGRFGFEILSRRRKRSRGSRR